MTSTMWLILGMCIGAVVATILYAAAAYFDYKGNKMPRYKGTCTKRSEKKELLDLIHKHDGEVITIEWKTDKYYIEWECTPVQQMYIGMEWLGPSIVYGR